MGKARLAAAFRKPTTVLLEQWEDRPLFAQSLTEVIPQGVTLNPGGHPVILDGTCVGALGVGGGRPDQDGQVAERAVVAFGERGPGGVHDGPSTDPPPGAG
jgi:uncharacterized protein GlcG (DUF336 family)